MKLWFIKLKIMNYKILFLTVLMLANSFILASIKSNSSKTDESQKTELPSNPSSHEKSSKAIDPFIWSDDLSHMDHIFHGQDHSSIPEDEIKGHHLHFTRIQRRRYWLLRSYFFKGVFVVSQTASLIYSFVHILHY
jgi:hypothetical protein